MLTILGDRTTDCQETHNTFVNLCKLFDVSATVESQCGDTLNIKVLSDNDLNLPRLGAMLSELNNQNIIESVNLPSSSADISDFKSTILDGLTIIPFMGDYMLTVDKNLLDKIEEEVSFDFEV